MIQNNGIIIVTCKDNADRPPYCVQENHRCRILMDSFMKRGVQCALCDYNLTNLYSRLEGKYIIFDVTRSNIHQTLEIINNHPEVKDAYVLWFKNRKIYNLLCKKYKLEDYQVIIGEGYSNIVSYILGGSETHIAYFDTTAENLARNENTIFETYLDKILLNGGLCEILAGGQCNKCDNCFRQDVNIRESLSQGELTNEMHLLRKLYNIRKISIVNSNFFANEALTRVFQGKEYAPDIQYSICCCYKDIKENIGLIESFKESLYNIDLYIDIYSNDVEQIITLIKDMNIRVKIHFALFSEKSTEEGLIKLLTFLEKGICTYAPDCLFTKTGELTPSMMKIYIVLNIIYKRLLLSQYLELVNLENSLKREFRLGLRSDYDKLDNINTIIKEKSYQLNCLLFKLIRCVIENEKRCSSIHELLYCTVSKEKNDLIDALCS